MNKFSTALLALALLSVPVLAFTPMADIEQQMKDTKFKFDKEEEEDYTVTLNWDDEKRSQMVTIREKAEDISSTDFKAESREIWSLCYSGKEFDKDQLKKLMSEHYKLGAFQIEEQGEEEWTAYFRIDVPADCDAAFLRNAIRVCAEAADNMEKELTPDKDDF